MTAPITVGFPDYGRQSADATILEINDVGVVANGVKQYPIRWIGNAESFFVLANPSTGGAQFSIDYYADAAGLEQLGSYQINCALNDQAWQPIPVLGPYMGAHIFSGVGGNYSYTFLVWRTPHMGYLAGAAGQAFMFSKDSVAIAGNTLISLDCATVQEGPAVWSASVTGGSFTVGLDVVDYLGAKTRIDEFDNTASPMAPRTVYLPPWHISVDILNQNAAAQTYKLMMTRRHNI